MKYSLTHRLSVWARPFTLLLVTFLPALSADLQQPYTLSSQNGLLDILMVAKASAITTLPNSPTGWVYDICLRPSAAAMSCPASTLAPNFYGGSLLRLQQGDTLKIRLVNQLPLVLDSKHAQDPGMAFLAQNPTNLHTHGMLVSPHKATDKNPTYGDYVYVLTFNSANGPAPSSILEHAAVRYDYTDYEIKVPASHPSGLFWFHPHEHGLALNQMSAGLGGLITVGDMSDYLCKNRSCSQFLSKIGVQPMTLKDSQILPSGLLKDQPDPMLCAGATPLPAKPDGHCDGQDTTSMGGENYAGAHWYFTLNGQQYPTISVKEGGGEIWRIANVSGSATYNLSLFNPTQNKNMMFQVLSMDGVSVEPTPGMSMAQAKEIAGGKFVPEACPGAAADPNFDQELPLCTRTLHMMPAARAEVWVTYRGANDNVHAAPSPGEYAIFRTDGYSTGPTGDNWPAINLAKVNFISQNDPFMPPALGVNGAALAMLKPAALASDPAVADPAVTSDPTCSALPPGHMRRVFYGIPSDNPNGFGLAYEELDANGNLVGPAATDLIPYDPTKPTICVPLGAGNSPATERWQLVNVATEDHNFHIHQVKFRVVSKDELAGGSSVPLGRGVDFDNVPLPAGAGVCGAGTGTSGNQILDYRMGLCTATPITVDIPFAIAGDFVYHCHILEHEDGGMMARIRVRPTK